MRYGVMLLLFLAMMPLSAPNAVAANADSRAQGVLVRSITIDGFVLQDKEQFTRLFKPYRNKYLTEEDTDQLLKQIQVIYEREGYQQLVSITYKLDKHHLAFSVLMTS